MQLLSLHNEAVETKIDPLFVEALTLSVVRGSVLNSVRVDVKDKSRDKIESIRFFYMHLMCCWHSSLFCAWLSVDNVCLAL